MVSWLWLRGFCRLWRSRLWVCDGCEELGPIWEDDVGCDASELFEEVVSRDPGRHGVLPGQDAQLRDGVISEGQEVEGHEDTDEGFLAVAKIVLEVVPIGLEDVEGLVLDLPPGAPARGQFGDGLGGAGGSIVRT